MQEITKYADAAPELKAKMDVVIEPVDKNPADPAVINSFGDDFVLKLNTIINDTAALVQKFQARDIARIPEDAAVLESRCSEAKADLAVCLGAAAEILRRYDEVYVIEKKEVARQSFADRAGLFEGCGKTLEDVVSDLSFMGHKAAAMRFQQEMSSLLEKAVDSAAEELRKDTGKKIDLSGGKKDAAADLKLLNLMGGMIKAYTDSFNAPAKKKKKPSGAKKKKPSVKKKNKKSHGR